MAKLKWLLLTALLNFTSEAYKILVIFPVPGKSHGILGEGIIRHLLQAEHEVTYITPFSKNHNHPNLHKVPVDSNYKVFNEDVMNIKAIMDGKFDAVSGDFILHMMVNLSKSTLEDENVQTFLRDPKQQYDAVIAEWMFTELYAAIPPLFDCPLIWFSTLDPHWKVLSLIDEVLNPAYSTGYQTYYPTPFTLSQRVNELWILLSELWRKNFRRLGMEKEIFDTSIAPLFLKRGKPVPTYEDLTYNASLVLGNSHVSMGQPTRLPQNYIPIGGYHIDTYVKPLPEDIKKVMDESKYGVIYFSMGSNLKSKDLPDELKKGFLKIFSGLKQTVLWKFEEILSDLPENVRILKWAPQQSILSHPNCILFITHGGLLSTTEAIHFGVPIIGIPVFADQFSNVDRSVIKGFAKRVDLSYTMLDDLSVTINEILRNTSYSERAKELSFIYHHRVATPGAELVHWVEHVVRTRGAPHLRSPALLVPWYQKMYLDLAAVLVLVITLLCNFVKAIFISTKNNKQFNKKKKQ